LRGYAVKTELVDSGGQHIRYLPGPLARAMVAAGHADVANVNGRVKAVRLITAASTHAMLIGPPTGEWGAPPFSVRERLDGGYVTWKHHPRSTYEW
jgi:hypothetical protein